MEIPLEIGDVVTFTGSSSAQMNYGTYSGDYSALEIGKSYTISNIEVRSWHTKLSFKEIPGTFNSVCFE